MQCPGHYIDVLTGNIMLQSRSNMKTGVRMSSSSYLGTKTNFYKHFVENKDFSTVYKDLPI